SRSTSPALAAAATTSRITVRSKLRIFAMATPTSVPEIAIEPLERAPTRRSARLAVKVVVTRVRNDHQVLVGALEARVRGSVGRQIEKFFLPRQDNLYGTIWGKV